jgi:hypothetical protein
MPFEQAGGVGKGLRERRLGLFADDDLTFLVLALARARLEINRGMVDNFFSSFVKSGTTNQCGEGGRKPATQLAVGSGLEPARIFDMHAWGKGAARERRPEVLPVFLQGPGCFLL